MDILRVIMAAILSVILTSSIGQCENNQEKINNPETIAEACRQLLKQNRFQEVLKLCDKAFEQRLTSPSILVGCAMAHEALNQPKKAEEYYRMTLREDQNNYISMENLAGILELSEAGVQEAAVLYEKALKLDPRPEWKETLPVWIAVLKSRNRNECSFAVSCWQRANDLSESEPKLAEAYYSKAVQMDPLMFQAYFSRGLLRLKMKEYAAAVRDFDKAEQLAPGLRSCLVQKGLALEQLGEVDAAFITYRTAIEADPNDPEVHYHVGRMLEAENRYEEALQCFISSARLRPSEKLRHLLTEAVSSMAAKKKTNMNFPKINGQLW
jgi:tetratricopeptide (TPR) repeat protein